VQFLSEPPYDPPSAWDITPAEYHADRRYLTRSMIGDFLASPQRFRQRWIDETLSPKPQTDAMTMGTAFHAMMAAGDLAGFATWNGVRRGKKWDAFKSDKHAARLTILTEDQYAAAVGMRDAVMADPWVSARLDETTVKVEHVIRWVDETGLRCKCMIDCLIAEEHDGFVVLDWKSSADPTPESWVSQSRRFGLHRQAAHYSNGISLLHENSSGFSPVRWVYVVVGSEPPHDVYLYEPDLDVVALGDRQVCEALDGIRACLDTSEWHHADRGRVVDYSYPPWFMKEKGVNYG